MNRKNHEIELGTQIKRSTDIILNVFFIIVAIACLYPLFLVLGVSLTDEMAIRLHGYHLIPKQFSLEAYKFVLKNGTAVARGYLNTIIVTLVGSTLGLFIMAMYAYPLSRDDFKYKGIFNFIVVFTMLFNGGMVPHYIIYVNVLHIKDKLIALVLLWIFNAFYVMIIRTFYKSNVPKSLIEAAQIDGAGEFYIFFKIVMPLAKPALATVFMFSMLVYWNDWFGPYLYIMSEKKFNLQYLMYRIEQNIQMLARISGVPDPSAIANLPSEGARMAMAIVGIGPVILAYPFFQRYFERGITLGATKE